MAQQGNYPDTDGSPKSTSDLLEDLDSRMKSFETGPRIAYDTDGVPYIVTT